MGYMTHTLFTNPDDSGMREETKRAGTGGMPKQANLRLAAPGIAKSDSANATAAAKRVASCRSGGFMHLGVKSKIRKIVVSQEQSAKNSPHS
jgi:hypothetical protein